MNPNTIDAALESHLLTLANLPPIAWEDVSYKPSVGLAYLQVNQLRNTPIEYGIANDIREDRGILQVTVVCPGGKGKVAAVALASRVAEHFPIDLEIDLTTHHLSIQNHPSIHTGIPDEGWYRVPVSIPWQTLPR